MQSLETGLARASTDLKDAVRTLAQPGRADFTGLPPGALELLLTEAARAGAPPALVVTADQATARDAAAALTFFGAPTSGGSSQRVLPYPAADVSPFAEVAPDRRAAMERIATLSHLAQGQAWSFVVAPITALLRRVAPRRTLAERSRTVREADVLERDDLLQLLSDNGYLRVPLVEDPGSFAVRGGLIDVYPPQAARPVRIELDDDLVCSLRYFDPDTQRTGQDAPELFIHPARQTTAAETERAVVRQRVSDLCDDFDMPSRKRNQLLDDLQSGRAVLGIDGLLPAFHDGLQTVFDYLPDNVRTVVVDPTACTREVTESLDSAHADRQAKVSEGGPAYTVEQLYLDVHELREALEGPGLVAAHRLAVAGASDDSESPLSALEPQRLDDVKSLGGEDQKGLAAQLLQQRKQGGRLDALLPLAEQVQAWLDNGLRVMLCARTRTQGDRLAGLLRGYEVPIAGSPEPFDPGVLASLPPGKVEFALGELASGFVLATAGLVCVTESEVFGSRGARRAPKARKAARGADLLQDLSELSVGDFVVHVDHGVGRYLGLEQRKVPLSRYEEMQGMKPIAVEVLAVEYLGGKLFLPVTRLNQIQKHSAKDGKAPRLDKLGGQTFAKTKQRVRGDVRKLADDLLKVYAQRAANQRPPVGEVDRTFAEFEASFPFDETVDQARAIEDVLGDLDGRQAMDRVVCGDVGFGKTEVAMRAAFRVAMAGKQVALLCPTTVLAQQHYNTFRERMADYPLRIATLSRFVPRKQQTEVLRQLKKGEVDVLIGTHRVLSKDVHFHDLGLLVVDEEQRFGVAHKERIKSLRAHVDVLTLSATPIPRTLQMAVTGLRDLSLITTPPTDRRAIRTFVTRWDEHVIREAVQRELTRGGQVFFVHNRIDSLHERAARLQELVPDARIAVAHGQMNERTLEKLMAGFIDGDFDVLASTAIVESGLDIPRANTILIDRADTYGLAQLYQLRGRVGRSRERAYCYLVAPPPSAMSDEARSRIEALERFTELGSGFKVASLDLELRGAGDVLGAEQSGSVAAVGFDLFVKMLEEAVAELKGEPAGDEVDPEINLDMPLFLPDDYIEDVGLRLSMYKRLASAVDEEAVAEVGREMEDRFGPPPLEARMFVRAMALKPQLRRLKVLGCEATSKRITLHLRQDAPLDGQSLLAASVKTRGALTLTPDNKLTRKIEPDPERDSVDQVQALLRELQPHVLS